MRSAREELGISLADAAHETHIRLNYLQELENDHPELLHSAAQARGFLRLYAEFLGLSYEELLTAWEKSETATETAQPQGQIQKPAPAWFKKLLPIKEEKTPIPGEAAPAEESPAEISPGMEDQTSPEPSLPDREIEAIAAVETPPAEELPQAEPQAETAASEDLGIRETDAEKQKPGRSLQQAIAGLGAAITRWKPLAGLLKGVKTSQEGEGTGESSADVKGQTSEEIFHLIGLSLQNRRRMMDLNLADIENFTNLKRGFLLALEEGRFSDLPSTVQGRGMLNNYAQFLGMEELDVMTMYARALQLQSEERLKPQRKPARPPVMVSVNLPERWRKVLNPDLIIGSALIIGLFAFIIWGASQVFNSSSGAVTEAPSISEVLQTTPSQSPESDLTATAQAQITQETTPLPGITVAESTPTVVATVNDAPLQVYIIANDRAYLKAEVDGREVFNGRVSPNNVYTYSGNTAINLLTGNASALEVYFNQEFIGKLGGVGEVKSITFTLEGLSTPTPRVTATPTLTPNAATQQAADAASRQ